MLPHPRAVGFVVGRSRANHPVPRASQRAQRFVETRGSLVVRMVRCDAQHIEPSACDVPRERRRHTERTEMARPGRSILRGEGSRQIREYDLVWGKQQRSPCEHPSEAPAIAVFEGTGCDARLEQEVPRNSEVHPPRWRRQSFGSRSIRGDGVRQHTGFCARVETCIDRCVEVRVRGACGATRACVHRPRHDEADTNQERPGNDHAKRPECAGVSLPRRAFATGAPRTVLPVLPTTVEVVAAHALR